MAIVDTELGYLGRFRAAINAGMRIRGSTLDYVNNAASFTHAAHVRRRGHHHRRLDRGQERGHRRPRPVVRHRAAEVRPGRASSTATTASIRYRTDNTGATRETMKPSAEAIGAIKLYLARNSFFEVGGGWQGLQRLRLARRRARSSASSSSRRSATATATATRTTSTSAPTIRRTSTTSRTKTAAPSPTTTRTASSTIADKCPNEPETKNGYQDEDGCPDSHHLRPRRRPHPRRRRQVPRRSGGLRRLRGRGRLPRSGQRQGRHQGRRRRLPERPRGQGRLRGHRTAAPIPTTTTTASSTSATSARTSPRPTTASTTTTAAPIRAWRR